MGLLSKFNSASIINLKKTELGLMAVFALISGISDFLSLPQRILLALLATLLHMTLVSSLRHQRAKLSLRKLNYVNRESYSKMTTDEAQSLLKDLAELEFPTTFGLSIIFALFKACYTLLLPIPCTIASKGSFMALNIFHHRPTVSRAYQIFSSPRISLPTLKPHLSELLTQVSYCLNFASTDRHQRGRINR